MEGGLNVDRTDEWRLLVMYLAISLTLMQQSKLGAIVVVLRCKLKRMQSDGGRSEGKCGRSLKVRRKHLLNVRAD